MNEDIHSDAPAGTDASTKSAPAPEGGNETASDAVRPLHQAVNDALGTTYKSDEDALKGIRETRDYVGKAGKYEKAVKAISAARGMTEDDAVRHIMESATQPGTSPDPAKFVSREEFEETLFYKDNPDLAGYRDLLSPLAKQTGKPLSEVVQLESFQQLITAKAAHDETQKSKSVLASNSRLGQVTDKITQANEALKSGNHSAAAQGAVDAVLEAYSGQ